MGHPDKLAHRLSRSLRPRVKHCKPESRIGSALWLRLRPLDEANLTRVRGIAVESHLTLEAHLAKLAEFRDKAAAAGKFGDAITAEVARGKALGFYVERRETGKVGEFTAKTRQEAVKKPTACSKRPSRA